MITYSAPETFDCQKILVASYTFYFYLFAKKQKEGLISCVMSWAFLRFGIQFISHLTLQQINRFRQMMNRFFQNVLRIRKEHERSLMFKATLFT